MELSSTAADDADLYQDDLDRSLSLVRETAGADFVFALSRNGALLSSEAPQAMPAEGRRAVLALVEALPHEGHGMTTLPREHLVPYGGAAPVDLHVLRLERLLVVVVMSSWVEQAHVRAVISGELPALRICDEKAADIASVRPTVPSGIARRVNIPPAGPFQSLVRLAAGVTSDPEPELDARVSLNRISLHEAPIGRATAAALEVEGSDAWLIEGDRPTVEFRSRGAAQTAEQTQMAASEARKTRAWLGGAAEAVDGATEPEPSDD